LILVLHRDSKEGKRAVAESKDIFVPYSVPNPGADRFDDRVAQISGCAPAKAGSHKDFRISGIFHKKINPIIPRKGKQWLKFVNFGSNEVNHES
jgi:hypothetical protein